jgi:hypothetical protein
MVNILPSPYQMLAPTNIGFFGTDAGDGLMSNDELACLKRDLQAIIQEKAMLKARITRLAAFAHSSRSSSQPEMSGASLADELRETENYIGIVKAAIAEVNSSERAQLIRSRKEEIASLHEQLKCSELARREKAREFREAAKELDLMVKKYSKEGLQASEKLIETLKAQVARESERIEFRKKELESVAIMVEMGEYQEARDELKRKIQEIDDKIAQQELNITKLNETIEAEKIKGEEELKVLHSQV